MDDMKSGVEIHRTERQPGIRRISPPVLRRMPGAVVTSLRAVLANPGTMALWGLTVAAFLALGTLAGFVGLIIVLPVLGHATWHLYRAVVAD